MLLPGSGATPTAPWISTAVVRTMSLMSAAFTMCTPPAAIPRRLPDRGPHGPFAYSALAAGATATVPPTTPPGCHLPRTMLPHNLAP